MRQDIAHLLFPMIYLDNNSTTPIHPEVLPHIISAMNEMYANPHSHHSMGRDASLLVEEARISLAEILCCKPRQIIFTSGGTEANGIALTSYISYGYTIFCLETDHPSVRKYASGEIRVTEEGHINLDHLEDVLDTVLSKKIVFAFSYANNETGVRADPTGDVARICSKRDVVVHIDAVQLIGKISIPADWLNGVNSASISGHKFCGPKGIGALILLEDKCIVDPTFLGGSHEGGVRPGTLNVPGIVGMAHAAKLKPTISAQANLIDYIERELADIATVNGGKRRVCNTTNLHFPAVKDLQQFLENLSMAGVCVSGMSACNSGILSHSRVLESMYGGDSPKLKGSIRIAVSPLTTQSEIEKAIDIIKKVVRSY